jgi:hypothetical protein
MKQFYFLFIALLVFAFASAELIVGQIPEWVELALAVVAIPLIVELLKALVSKFPAASWISGRVVLSIISYVIALGITAAFVNWGELPTLPQDAMEATNTILTYSAAFFGAATALYNILVSKLLDASAQKGNSLLSYRLK